MQIPAITIVLVDSFFEKMHKRTISKANTPTDAQEIMVVTLVTSISDAKKQERLGTKKLPKLSLNIQKNPPKH